MARWKARTEFLLSVVELLFLSLTVEALQGKMCQNSLPSGWVGHLQLRFQGEGVVLLPYTATLTGGFDFQHKSFQLVFFSNHSHKTQFLSTGMAHCFGGGACQRKTKPWPQRVQKIS